MNIDSNNDSDNNDVDNKKLSEYIFNIISIHLIHKESIKRVLELSLLSKSVFKTIQNVLVSHELNRYRFLITLPELLEYIKKANTSGNQDNYKYKLIQYKEIERIKVFIKNDEQFAPKHSKFGNYSAIENKNQQVKDTLFKNCPKLKKVVILNKVECKFDVSYDFTCGGFFKVKKLHIHWDCEMFPHTAREEESFDYDMDPYEEVVHHEFSFSYLSKYNPSVFYITTTLKEMGLNMQNLSNVFNCKSIKSYIFKGHKTPTKFFTSVFEQSNPVTSLSVILNDKMRKKVKQNQFHHYYQKLILDQIKH